LEGIRFHDRYESALADLEICRIRTIPDRVRPSPAVGQRNQTAVKTAVVAMDGHLCLSSKGMPARSARFDLRKKVKPTEAFLGRQ
jgi:hypothetical protein